MNQSQELLNRLASDPKKAIEFLKRVNALIGIQKRNWSRVIIAYLLGIVTALVLIDTFSDATFWWFR